VPTLELLPSDGLAPADKAGEVFALAFTQDGAFALSGGWDGYLRLWEVDSGHALASFQAATKPLSACAISPDAKHWLSGSMDGVLGLWDPVSHAQTTQFLAHTRPVAAITFAPDCQTIATAGWDRKLTVRPVAHLREGQTLSGHADLVTGCRYLPDSSQLVSWSHDATVRVWDLATGEEACRLSGHGDRVNAAAVSPDGKWIASAARDQELKLWDWREKREVGNTTVNAEPRALFFLPDGSTLIAVDAEGWLTLYSVPDLKGQEEVETELPVQCAELAPSGGKIGLGCTDGRVRFVKVGGVELAPLMATATPTTREIASPLSFLFGKKNIRRVYACICPACNQPFEREALPGKPAPCPRCRRTLRFYNAPPVMAQRAEIP
jgi:WD40 repeat protein